MNVLISGGAGFLGRHVFDRLYHNSTVKNLYVLDNLDPLCGGDRERGHDTYLIPGDIRDADLVLDLLNHYKITHIVHLAAYGRNLTCAHFVETAWHVNVNGTLNILSAALQTGVTRVVCCSSNIVISPIWTVYKATKVSLECLTLAYQRMGLSCCSLRPSNIMGSGQSPKEYQKCAFRGLNDYYKEHGCFSITGDGTQTRDFIHAKEVARAFELALFSEYNGEALDITTGRQVSMNDIGAMLNVPIVYAPARDGDAQSLVSDTGPAKKAIGFENQLKLEDVIWDSFPDVPHKEKENE